jgi:hypothetical protein
MRSAFPLIGTAFFLVAALVLACLKYATGNNSERLKLAAELGTGIAAFSAVAISIYAADLSRRQRRDSQIPVLVLEGNIQRPSGKIDNDTPGKVLLLNRGVGPAIDLRVRREKNNRVLSDFDDRFPAIIGAGQQLEVTWNYSVIEDIFHGTHNVIGTPEYEYFQSQTHATYRVMAQLTLEYKDIYGNRYEADVSLETRADPSGSYEPSLRTSAFRRFESN